MKLKRLFALLLCLVLTLSALPVTAHAAGEEITVYNWGQYISDGTDDCLDVIAAFEEETGIKVNYLTFDSNESMYTKLKTGGISVDGWKTLWKYCAEGKFGGDDWKYGFDPLNKGDVAVSSFYSSSLYGKLDAAAEGSEHPITDCWKLVDIDDGTYYIAEYIGILDRADRTPEQTEAVKAFAEWFGSAETQAAWAEEFDSFPCNQGAVELVYGSDVPEIYLIKNFALTTVEGTDMTYAAYVAAHSSEWTNIMTNLGFYWADASNAPAEPDWDNLDWATLTQKAE